MGIPCTASGDAMSCSDSAWFRENEAAPVPACVVIPTLPQVPAWPESNVVFLDAGFLLTAQLRTYRTRL